MKIECASMKNGMVSFSGISLTKGVNAIKKSGIANSLTKRNELPNANIGKVLNGSQGHPYTGSPSFPGPGGVYDPVGDFFRGIGNFFKKILCIDDAPKVPVDVEKLEKLDVEKLDTAKSFASAAWTGIKEFTKGALDLD